MSFLIESPQVTRSRVRVLSALFTIVTIVFLAFTPSDFGASPASAHVTGVSNVNAGAEGPAAGSDWLACINAQWMDHWVYIGGTTWDEYVGWFIFVGNTWKPCIGTAVVATTNCSGTFPFCPPILFAESPLQFQACHCVAVPAPGQGGVVLLNNWNTKGKPVIYATLDATGYSPVGVAVASDQTVYASGAVFSGSAPSGVLVYAPGSKTPTGLLSDPASGQSAAGIAVDGTTKDVYWAFNTSGSLPGRIDVFRGGTGSPHPFFMSSSQLGDVRIDTKHRIVVSLSAGGIAILGTTGHVIRQWSVSGSPTSISLDKANTHLYVVDPLNQVVSKYTYPGGTLVSSGNVTINGNQVTPASVMAYPL